MNILSFLLISISLFSNPNVNDNSVQLVCPQDVWLPCGAEIWNLSNYGTAYYYVNGQQFQAPAPQVSYDLTTCETGKIYRTWSVEDYNWNIISCTQTIYINGGNFNYTHINWPEDNLQLNGCNVSVHPNNLPEGYGKPEFDYISCSMVGSSYKDQVFYFGPDCKKILRKWTVLDWCNYYPGSNSPGIWTYTQTIKVSNTDAPTLTCPAAIEVNPNNCNGTYVNLEDVSLVGTGCYGDYSITNSSVYADENKENASGFYPIGTTKVTYSVEYACGQTKTCQQEIKVLEKAPVPYCLSTLNVALMPVDTDQDGLTDDGMVEVWAKDLNYASYHPCRPNEYLKYSFSSNTDSTFRIFTCEHIGENDLQLWVTDTRGNQAWCAITINIQNNAANIPNCQPESTNRALIGEVMNGFSEPLENVYIDLKSRAYFEKETVYDTILKEVVVDSMITQGGLIIYFYDYEEVLVANEVDVIIPGQKISLLTDENGKYASEEIDPSRKYTMTAFKFGDNSTIDIEDINILKSYINKELEFTNMYSFFAADVNEDNEIDLLDLEILQSIYDGEEDEWPLERQWVFYDSKSLESLSDVENPLYNGPSKVIILENNLNRFDEQRFTGVLKGDLSNYESFKANKELETRQKSLNTYRISPNPFNNYIELNNESLDVLQISIFDISGRVVYNKESNEGQITIDNTATWSSGTYYLRIVKESQISVEKLIKL